MIFNSANPVIIILSRHHNINCLNKHDISWDLDVYCDVSIYGTHVSVLSMAMRLSERKYSD